jgi:thiamine biosynthesis lipoprotein
MIEVVCRRRAMATLFEVFLVGEEEEHLAAVGEAALDEVARIEHLLSRYDPSAEVARVNRHATAGPVKVDAELFRILEECGVWCERTEGAFDPCAGSGVRYRDAVRLDTVNRTVAFVQPASLDLGAYGKGYAVDAAADVLQSFGVERFLIHGGTSSVLARGERADGSRWRIDLRDPFDDREPPVGSIELQNAGLSCSAVTRDDDDIVDPRTGDAISNPAACAVVAENATIAEVWSTALLAMGRDKARECDDPRLALAWIAPGRALEWLIGGPQ